MLIHLHRRPSLTTGSNGPHHFVLIRPVDLDGLARRLRAAANVLADGARRIDRAGSGTWLNPADANVVAASPATRAAAVSLGLRRAADGNNDDAARAADSATRAALGDSARRSTLGAGLICLVPEQARVWADLVDPVLGSALARGATNLLHLADQWLPGDDQALGDPGGTFSTRLVPLANAGGAGRTSGRPPAQRLLADAMVATADVRALRHDEFGLIRHGPRRFTVVLPGVIDLSDPTIGWNREHRSVRDLDMAAIGSSRSSSVADNPYARMVAQALDTVGVQPGAEIVLVGHSFGADTALDLAADPRFTSRFDVSGVVATGYYSQPQLQSVDPAVPVLVLQNRHDVVIGAGSLMPGPGNRSIRCPVEDLDDPTDSIGPSRHLVLEFDGGWSGLGHQADTYRDVFLGSVQLDPAGGAGLRAFTSTLSNRGFRPESAMVAIDVSVPAAQPADIRSAPTLHHRRPGPKIGARLGRKAHP